MAKRKKVIEEPEEILAEEAETPSAPIKDHHWSDDGPRYNVMKEAPESDPPGTRIYRTFFETDDLALAKHECLAQFEAENKTTLIMDRAEWNKEIVRHESYQTTGTNSAESGKTQKTKVKDDSNDAAATKPAKVRSKPLTVKRK
jgi:hypothetical protein